MEKIEIIDQILSSGNSAKITLKECGDRCPTFFEPNKTVLDGYLVSIDKGEPLSDDLKFTFLRNKLDKYSKEYPQIYDNPAYQIADYKKASEAKTTLELLQQYRDKILRNASTCKDKENCKKVLSSIRNYQNWYMGQNEQGRENSGFLANLSRSLGLSNFTSYDASMAYFNSLEPGSLNTDKNPYVTPVTRLQPVEMASLHDLSKSTGIMEACKKVIGDSEHIIDNITSNLKSYIQNDTPSAEYIKNINISLESQPKDIAVLNDMVKDVSDIKLKNIFFGLISNRYKFKTPHVAMVGDNLLDILMPKEQADLKNKLIKTFGTQRINRAISTALNEYVSLVGAEKTRRLFSYSDNLKKEIKDDFNSEIKRMNMACKAVNILHSDMMTGKKNPDLEEIVSAVNESYKAKLAPMAVVYNPDDKSWRTMNDFNVNGSKKNIEEKREEIRKYLGDKRYYELYRQAYDKSYANNNSHSSEKLRLPTSDELNNIQYYGETGFDLLLQEELRNRLSSISSKNNNKEEYRLATDEELELTRLLDNKDNIPDFSFNRKMINDDVTVRLKKVMEETVRQSSYNIANTKFIHLLLVNDFRKGLLMDGSEDVIHERCFLGDGKLFNEATVSSVKDAIAKYDEMTFDAMDDLSNDFTKIKSLENVNRNIKTASVYQESDESKKIDFIKESIK
ncbi:MAG: hypothetical protein NTY22_00150, partial [Proteobacteria bacterium]|nr:hypothetical protein [Pseudomonadota bacterium]